MARKKIIGWGKNSNKETINGSSTTYDDIVINSTSLSVEEGEEQEAQIEGGEAEARKKNPDKYILESERRIDDPSDVNDVLGFTEEVDSIEVEPQEVGAVGVTLINPSRHVTVTYDTTDGLKAKYTYKTKGATDSNGRLTDITFQKKVSNAAYIEVSSTTGKNPKNEGWYIKNGNVYIPSLDTTPQTGVTYYSRG